jgi:hypothetical protein
MTHQAILPTAGNELIDGMHDKHDYDLRLHVSALACPFKVDTVAESLRRMQVHT